MCLEWTTRGNYSTGWARESEARMKALELIASALLTAALVGFCMLGEPIWWVAALATALGILGASLGGLVWRQGRHERG